MKSVEEINRLCVLDDMLTALDRATYLLDRYKAGFEISSCDEYGDCYGCAEEAEVEWVIDQLQRARLKIKGGMM